MNNLDDRAGHPKLQGLANRILLVDDDQDCLVMVDSFLNNMGYLSRRAENAKHALDLLHRESFDILITDLVMPEMDGMELLKLVTIEFPHVDVIIITGFGQKHTFNDVINAGAKDFLEKPFTRDGLQATINHIVRARELQQNLLQEIEIRRQTEEKLQKALRLATEAGRIKKEFMAKVSHELRTPMNGIIGFADLLLEQDLAKTEHHYLKIIKNSADRLMKSITTILDFSDLETGAMELKEQDLAIEEILAVVVAQFREIATLKSIVLSYEVADDIPPHLVGDREQLTKILHHIFDNAVKFTSHGEVGVKVKLTEKLPGKVAVTFTVWDSGCGVSASQRREIFEAFSQADGSYTRPHEGLGLGLTIASQLITLMGGRVSLAAGDKQKPRAGNPRPSSGLVIRFQIPLSVAPTRAPTAAPAKSPPPKSQAGIDQFHILLAEDDATNGFLLSEFFEINGWRVTLAKNGREALTAFDQSEFDLALFDIMMPEMDGLEATAAIREKELQNSGKNLPIIALSGLAMPGIRERCSEAGMNDYITKPISTSKLLELVHRHLPGETKAEKEQN